MMHPQISIQEFPTYSLAYISHLGEDGLMAETYQKLINWAKSKGFLPRPEAKLLTIYHDSFRDTPPEKVRMSACLMLPGPVEPEAFIGFRSIKAGKFAVGRFDILPDDFGSVWRSMFTWLKESGFQWNGQDPFEIYQSEWPTHPEGKLLVDLCIPVTG